MYTTKLRVMGRARVNHGDRGVVVAMVVMLNNRITSFGHAITKPNNEIELKG